MELRKMQDKELLNLVKFFHLVEKLKLEKRRGWLDRGVKDCESVADHSFRLALMAMVFAKRQKLDVDKAVKMALVHDLPEAICGDVASRIKEADQKISNKEKQRKEIKALDEMLGFLDEGLAEEIRELWHDFEFKKSPEARLLYELDRVEAIFQAREYEQRANFKVSLKEFFDYMDDRLENKELVRVFGLLMKEREKK
jgi:putative hydrolase of HD superfamily